MVNLNRNIDASPAPAPNLSKAEHTTDVCNEYFASTVEGLWNSRADKSITDDESINSIEITGNLRRNTTSSTETREDSSSSASSQDIYDDGHEKKSRGVKCSATSIRLTTGPKDQQPIVCKPLTGTGGLKRKLVDYDDSESDVDECPTPPPVKQECRSKIEHKRPTNDLDLPIALRRSRRNRSVGNSTHHSSTTSSSTVQSTSQVRSS